MLLVLDNLLGMCLVVVSLAGKPMPPGQLPNSWEAYLQFELNHPLLSTTGVDFVGPITLGHTMKPTYVKAYVCVFVSLTTKAVHLELVSDLSTEAFLAALRHFVARCGCPCKILSDNGTNFVGANHELQKLYYHLETKESQGKICNFASARKIIWTFSPGCAPHFGGLWEAAVKSAKSLLRKLLGTLSLTVEEYATILTDVEATLNSLSYEHST